MAIQQLRKVGNSFVVTVSKEEVERLGAKEGDYIGSEHTLMQMRPVMRQELKDYSERNRDGLADLMNYLRDK